MIITERQSKLLLDHVDELEYQMGINLGYSSVWGTFVREQDEFIIYEQGHVFDAGGYPDAKIEAIHLLHKLDFNRDHAGIMVSESPSEFKLHDDKCREFYQKVLRSLEDGSIISNPTQIHEEDNLKIQITKLGRGDYVVVIDKPGRQSRFGVPIGGSVKEQSYEAPHIIAIIENLIEQLSLRQNAY